MTRSHKPLRILIVLALVLLTAAAYEGLRHNDFVNFDDDDYVTRNPAVQAGLTVPGLVWSLTTYHAGNWHPLTWLSHMLDVSLFGNRPAGHHLTSLLLHVLNGVLLFGFLIAVTGALWRPAFVAALFLVHPLHVESVAWLSERKDVLSTSFFLLALWSYARYAERPGLARYLVVFVLFALGLAAKPMLVTLPCVLLLLDFWPLSRRRLGGVPLTDLVVEKVPLLALSLGSSVLTIQAQGTAGLLQRAEVAMPLRLANAVVAYASYLGKTFWPTGLAVYYPFPESIPPWKTAACLALLLALGGAAVGLARRSPALPWGWLWYLGILFPVLGLVHGGGQAMADRYTYVPLVGVFVALAWGVSLAVDRAPALRPWVAATAVGAILVCAALTHRQAAFWRDSVTLWEHTVAVTERNYSAHNMLGTALARRQQFDRAIEQYDEALRINPEHARSHSNLGLTLARLGRDEEAIEQLEEAVRLNPRYVEAHDNLGLALSRRGDLDAAIAHFEEAVRLDPGFAPAQAHLGAALLQRGETERARRHLTEALRLNPGLRQARLLLDGLSRGR